jgi:S1-C subfamily serine protease
MKTILMVTLVLALVAPALTQTRRRPRSTTDSQKSLTPREIAERAYSSVVVLLTEDSAGKPAALGSGFFVRDDVIATNHHVIQHASRVYAKIIGQNRRFEIVGTVGIDEEGDLALLKIGSKSNAHPLRLADANQVAVGDEIYVLGNPEGLEGTFSQGMVSALRGNRYIQITAPISHGSSGSPVLNQRGEVVGVAVSAIEEGQNLNFAIPVWSLKSLISRITSVTPIVPRFDDWLSAKTGIRFDGVYRRNMRRTGMTLYSYYRFYADGLLIYALTEGDTSQIRNWFSRENEEMFERTSYKIVNDSTVEFSHPYPSGETVDYKGRFTHNELRLQWHNQATDESGIDIFEFVKINLR